MRVSVTESPRFFICLACVRDERQDFHAPGWIQSKLAAHTEGCYTAVVDMPIIRKVAMSLLSGLLITLLLAEGSGAAMGKGVFRGFTEHITRQIAKDKVDFAEAESCTSWFYQQLKKPFRDRPEVQRLSFVNEDPDLHPCAKRYPGIDEARAAFAQSQSFLSLSLTFYQFALVADRDDNERYDAIELRDVLDSLRVVPVEDGLPFEPLARLNGKFDDVRQATEFTALTQGMQVLYDKGYRLTHGDQSAMRRVTGEH